MSSIEKPGGLRAARAWFVGLTVVCAAGAGASLWLQQHAVEQERAHARERATAYAETVVTPPLADRPVTGPIDGQAANELSTALRKEVFAVDHDVMLVRVWAPDLRLLFSSNPKEALGTSQAGDAVAIKAASKKGGNVTSSMSAGVLSTYVPLHVGGDVVGAIEVDRDEATVETALQRPYVLGRTAAAAAAGLFLLLTLVSFVRRRPKRAAALDGKAFAEGDGELAPAKKDKGKDRATSGDEEKLRSKLDRAEEARAALEMELGQLRTQVTTATESANRRVAQLERALEIAEEQMKDPSGSPATAALEAKVKDLESALATARAQTVEVQSRTGDLQARYGENQVLAERAQAEAEAARGELAAAQAKAADGAAQVEDLERRVADGEAAKNDLKQQISKLEEELRWAQAQTTETQPILQEAAAKAEEEKARAEELLDRATRAEARFEDAEQRSARAEERAAAAEARLAELEAAPVASPAGGDPDLEARVAAAEARAAEAEERLAETRGRAEIAEARAADLERAIADAQSAAPETPATVSPTEAVPADGGEVASQLTALQAKLEATEGRAKRAYAEAESARAELARTTTKLAEAEAAAEAAAAAAPPEPEYAHGEFPVDGGVVKTEVDRLGTELARALERAHAAEERGARLEAELVALHNGMSLGEGPGGPVPEGWASVGPRRNGSANGHRAEDVEDDEPSWVEAGSEPAPDEAADEPAAAAELEADAEPEAAEEAVPDVPVEGPSLRSRLARSAAQKKGRAIDEGAQRR